MQTETDRIAPPTLQPVVRPSFEHRFTFSATASDYFKVWLPNISLTILTLGLYGPWAKVRREQFFHSHTHLAGASFEYTADPVSILKGRLILFAILFTASLVAHFFPLIQGLITLAIVVGAPWLIVQGLKFRTRYTSYRNISFNFSGEYGEAFLKFVLLQTVGVATFGLLLPWAKHEQRRFVVTNFGFGRTKFAFASTLLSFYVTYIVAAIVFFVPLFVGGGVVVLIALAAAAKKEQSEIAAMIGGGWALVFALLAVAMVWFVFPLIRLKLSCLTWSAASLGEFKFRYSVSLLAYSWVALSNLFLRIVSLGLLSPYCKVRLYRFKLDRLSFVGPVSLDGFIGARQQELRAFGDEASDFADVGADFGL